MSHGARRPFEEALMSSPPDAGAIGKAAKTLRSARHAVALTGAGVSVESGIPDFRSPGGLWTVFDPQEYATLSCFLSDPQKGWRLYRALGRSIAGKEPNPAHRALAALEAGGRLRGIVTQNVDGLHQKAGSRVVLEIHGNHGELECLRCGRVEPFTEAQLEPGPVPLCSRCERPLKPNVVLFEEGVRRMREIESLLRDCDLLVVAGTSAEVYPASGLPDGILLRGGSVLEFNMMTTRLTAGGLGPAGVFVEGPAGTTLPALVEAMESLPH
jgi:NAD-dependent deacetylase